MPPAAPWTGRCFHWPVQLAMPKAKPVVVEKPPEDIIAFLKGSCQAGKWHHPQHLPRTLWQYLGTSMHTGQLKTCCQSIPARSNFGTLSRANGPSGFMPAGRPLLPCNRRRRRHRSSRRGTRAPATCPLGAPRPLGVPRPPRPVGAPPGQMPGVPRRQMPMEPGASSVPAARLPGHHRPLGHLGTQHLNMGTPPRPRRPPGAQHLTPRRPRRRSRPHSSRQMPMQPQASSLRRREKPAARLPGAPHRIPVRRRPRRRSSRHLFSRCYPPWVAEGRCQASPSAAGPPCARFSEERP